MVIKYLTVLVVSLALAVATIPGVALAHEGHDHADTAATRENAAATDGDRADARSGKRLDSAKLRVCQARQKNIDAIMNRSVARAEKHLDLFSAIAERVKSFYDKQGKAIDNYGDLVAAVDAAKAEAQSHVDALKDMSFSCDSDDPKGDIESFKTHLEDLRQALKDYRTAVKDLIVGVRSAQGSGG